jgi:hypothetical protein
MISANPPIRQSANWRKKKENVSTAETYVSNHFSNRYHV